MKLEQLLEVKSELKRFSDTVDEAIKLAKLQKGYAIGNDGIVYGKNSMGSYASQLDTKQRWKVVAYIKKVQSENGGEAFNMMKGETAVKDTVKTAVKAETKAAPKNEVKQH